MEPAGTVKKYPRSVFFIISNEFCERFTFYGLKTVLTIYLTKRLLYSEPTSTIIYHLFSCIAYFTPLIGAIIADSWLGKFRTILYLSLLYACGGVILSLGSFPTELSTMKLVSLIGLFIIALGTGGIKPCVSAFGGDQFQEGQEKHLQKFFSLFYVAINSGSLISTFITPMLRADVHCSGEKSCYPLAFGVPAILMIVAVLLFVCGKPFYIIRPPEGNLVLKVSQCVCYAVKRKFKSSEKKKAHWLDYADDKFDKNLIADIKILLRVLVLYIPLPVFWALFDQQGSRWTLQASRMDGTLNGYHFKPDQMQVINPLLIIAFIPLFDYVLYPLFNKCRLLTTPLQRMTTGGFLAAISFVITGFIELNLETAYPVLPSPGHSQLTIINNSPCLIRINESNLNAVDPFEVRVHNEMILNSEVSWRFLPENCNVSGSYDFTFNSSYPIESMMVTVKDESLTVMMGNDTKEKSKEGEPKIRIFYSTDASLAGENISFKLEREEDDITYKIDAKSPETVGMTEYYQFPPGKYKIYAPLNASRYQAIPALEQDLKSGAVYIVNIYQKQDEKNTMKFSTYEMVKGNFMSILFQLPQYIIITAAEILFSITGLEFSYSQSPASMKSVVTAAWLLTVAFGNLIVLVIAELKLFEKQSNEFFLFAALMGLVMTIFAVQSFFYKYVTIKMGNSEQLETSSKGKSNPGYVDETDFNK